ncbi:MAG TPA: PH domain-containing protein [Mycobacteriales bacterium]|nr:PH domain-containing protein [Mycobacteriales bacterium]
MAFPQSILDAGEVVVRSMRPHWRRLVFPVLLLPVVVGFGTYGILTLRRHGAAGRDGGWVALAIGLLILARWTLRPFLFWLSTRYCLTNRRVLMRSGVLSRSGRDIPLTRINDVSFQRTLVERFFGSGTLTIESAGERGQVAIKDVPQVEAVQRDIYRLVEAETQRLR